MRNGVRVQAILGDFSYPLWASQSAIFVLSTGRTGTDTLHHLYALSQDAISKHEPRPQLLAERQHAFHAVEDNLPVFQKIFRRARGYELLKARRLGKIYIETSARMTFLAPAIHALMPEAKFIYMTRHPADIVRSGMRRGWYTGHPADPYRITPRKTDPIHDLWGQMTPFEKICWYWAAYNRFSLNFFEKLDDRKRFLLKSEDFFEADMDLIPRLFQFAGLDSPSSSTVAQVMSKKINAQHDNKFPQFSGWSEEQKQALLQFAEPEIDELGYKISFESKL